MKRFVQWFFELEHLDFNFMAALLQAAICVGILCATSSFAGLIAALALVNVMVALSYVTVFDPES